MKKISLQEIIDMNYGKDVRFPESLDGIYCMMQSLSSEKDTQLIKIGESKERKDILCLKIGNGKRVVLTNARFEHPHEYHGTPALLKFAEILTMEKLWKKLDTSFYIFPAASPDGVSRNKWVKRGVGVVEYLKARIDGTSSGFSLASNGFENPSEELKQYIRLYEEIRPDYYFNFHGDGITSKNYMILHNSYKEVQKEAENTKQVWALKKHLIKKMGDDKPSSGILTAIYDGIFQIDNTAFEKYNKNRTAQGRPPYISSEMFLVGKFRTKAFTFEASYSQELSEDIVKITPKAITNEINKRLIKLKNKSNADETSKKIDDYLKNKVIENYLKDCLGVNDLNKAVKLKAKEATQLKYDCTLWAFSIESKLIEALIKDVNKKELANDYKENLYKKAESFPTKVYKNFYQESTEEKTDWIISTMLAVLT